jgi:chemotaxis protein methyltransferase CheR
MILSEDCQLSDADFKRIANTVYSHCGINLHEGKRELIRARIAKRLRMTKFADARAYLDHALSNPDGEEFTNLIDALSTNLTSFFRENQHFDFLADKLLPEVLANKRKANNRKIRCWSAGCSTGQEPYTIAMTLLESLGQADFDVKILATDLSTAVLARAAAGVYTMDQLSGVPVPLRAKYFDPRKVDGSAALAANNQLRSMIQFRYLNLMDTWPFNGPFDFIFCRNVMIYFDKPTQEKLVGRYWDVLAPRGILFTGHSESLTGIKHKFSFEQPTIYRK